MPINLYDSFGALFLIHGSTQSSQKTKTQRSDNTKSVHVLINCSSKENHYDKLYQKIKKGCSCCLQANAWTYTDHTYKDTHTHTQIWRVLQWAKRWEFKCCSKLWVELMMLVRYTEGEPEVWVAPQDFRISEPRRLYFYKYYWVLDTWRFDNHTGQHNFRAQNTILSLISLSKFFCSRVTETAEGVKVLALECWAKSKDWNPRGRQERTSSTNFLVFSFLHVCHGRREHTQQQ